MDPLYKLLPNGYRVCPYERSHVILGVRFIGHLLKCSKSSGKKFSVCPWNAQHHVVEPNDFAAHVIDCDNRVLVENMLRGIKSQQDIQNQMASSIPDVQTHVTQPEDQWSSDDDSEIVQEDHLSPGGYESSSWTLTDSVKQAGSQTGAIEGRANGEESGYRLPRTQPRVVRSGSPSGYGWSSDEEPSNGKAPKSCSGVQKAVPATHTSYGWSSDEEEPEIVDASMITGQSSAAGGMVEESEPFRSALPFVAYGSVTKSTLQSPQHSTDLPTRVNGFAAEGQKPMPTRVNGFAAEGRKSTPTGANGFAAEGQKPMPTTVKGFAAEGQKPMPTRANGFVAEGRKPMPTSVNGFAGEGQKPTPRGVNGFAEESWKPMATRANGISEVDGKPMATRANGYAAEGREPTPSRLSGPTAEGQKPTPDGVTGPSGAEPNRTPEEELVYLIDAFATTSFANSVNGVALLETLVQGLSDEVMQREK